MTETSSPTPLVELHALSKAFDGKTIIADLDLTINHGEFLTILGPSGCGKTTVLRLIAGLEDADRGRIALDGQDITAIPAEHRHVNTVFQSYALFPHMSVFDNVAFGLRMQKVPAAELTPRVEEALRMVQLDTFAKRRPGQLSGGQQQRVAIARAVVNKPKVLLPLRQRRHVAGDHADAVRIVPGQIGLHQMIGHQLGFARRTAGLAPNCLNELRQMRAGDTVFGAHHAVLMRGECASTL